YSDKGLCGPEPVFGIIKSVMGFRQFLLRGLDCVRGEWSLVTMAWNIKRMHVLSLGCALSMLAWIAARCLDTSRQRPSAIVAMIFSNLIAQSGSGCLAHRNQPRVRQAASGQIARSPTPKSERRLQGQSTIRTSAPQKPRPARPIG